MNKTWIEERADCFPSAVALEDATLERRVCYGELPSLFREHPLAGVKPGLLITRMGTGIEHAIELMAAAFLGHTILPVSPRLPDGRISRLLGSWGMENGVPQLLHEGSVILPGSPGEGTLLASSGSTGTPKLLFHPWTAHIVNAEGAAERIPLQPDHRWHINLPLWHTSGFAALFRTLHSGATAVFGSQPAGITHRSIVATQLLRELESGDLRAGSLVALLAGGGPVPSALRQLALDSDLPLHVTYGLTEAASQVCTTERLQSATPQTCGKILPGREIKFSNDGEILLRGPVLADGKWDHSRSLLTPLPRDASDWWATGDLGNQSSVGEIFITGRRDRMFVSAGENIHPERIEQALCEIPGIRQALVFGREDAEYGKVPEAFVDGCGHPDFWKEALADALSGLEIPRRWYAWPAGGDLHSTLKCAPSDFEELIAAGRAIPRD